MSLAVRPAASRQVAIYALRGLRVSLCAALWILFFLSLAQLGLQLPYPRAWNDWTVLVILRRASEPLLAPIEGVIVQQAAVFFYLIALAFLASVLLIILDSSLQNLRRRLEEKQASVGTGKGRSRTIEEPPKAS